MSLKVPIIASRIGGIVDIIEDNSNGFLIEPKNSKNLRDKIVELISDGTIRKQFVEKSFKKVDNFSSNKMTTRYKNIYNGLFNWKTQF